MPVHSCWTNECCPCPGSCPCVGISSESMHACLSHDAGWPQPGAGGQSALACGRVCLFRCQLSQLWTHRVRRCAGTVQEDAFEEVYKAQFIEFLAAVPPWFTLDIKQGVLTLHLARSDPSAFAAEVYGAALGQAVAEDFKFNFGHSVLQSALAVLRCKAQGRADVDVRPCSHVRSTVRCLPFLDTGCCADRKACPHIAGYGT